MHILPHSIPEAEQTAVENAGKPLQARIRLSGLIG